MGTTVPSLAVPRLALDHRKALARPLHALVRRARASQISQISQISRTKPPLAFVRCDVFMQGGVAFSKTNGCLAIAGNNLVSVFNIHTGAAAWSDWPSWQRHHLGHHGLRRLQLRARGCPPHS